MLFQAHISPQVLIRPKRTRLSMNPLEIASQLEGGTLSLSDALQAQLPDAMLHLFACDCAERSLLRERAVGRIPDPRSLEAIHTKRLWLFDKATDEERVRALEEAREAERAAWDHVKWAERRTALVSAYRAVWFTNTGAWYAADSAVRSCLEDPQVASLGARKCGYESAARAVYRATDLAGQAAVAEQRWQHKRLSWLLSLYEFAGERWIALAPGSPTASGHPPEVALDVDLLWEQTREP